MREKKAFVPRTERKYIGTYTPRTDGLKKAAGKAEYTDDMTLKRKYPDMLYLKILKSPYPHAKIKSIDSSAAEALPGVVGILRYDDPEIQALPKINGAYSDAVGTWTRAQAWSAGIFDRDILGSHARWVGDELGVAVAAETPETAEEAIKLLKVDWEVLPFALTIEDALKPDAPIIHPEMNPDSNWVPTNDYLGPDVFFDQGDFDKAYEEAEVQVEAETDFYNAEQGALEYWSGMIDWNEAENEMLVLSDSYCVDQTRWSMHELFGIPINNIRVITPYQGGQHGRADTSEQTFYYLCALMSKKTGRPVKYRQTRKEHFHDCRTTQKLKIKIGSTKEGKITACHIENIGNEGAYLDLGAGDIKISVGVWIESTPIEIPNLRMTGKMVYTNIIPSSCMRSVGNVGMNFILGLGIDMLAEKLDIDPVEIYTKSLSCRGVPAPNPCLEAVIQAGIKEIDWENRHAPGKGEVFEGSKKKGKGFCVGDTWHVERYEYRRGDIPVMIKLCPDGTVLLDAPTVEVGTGSNHCAVLACAEGLGVQPEKIKWISTQDTETGLKDQVQSDSSVSYMLGEATYKCAKQLKQKVLEKVSPMIEYAPEKLDILDGRVYVKELPEIGIDIEEYFNRVELEFEGDLGPIVAFDTRHAVLFDNGVSFMGAFAEVEVDTDTGAVKVEKLVIASDGGTILYPPGAEGQLIGGQCMGIGEALFERMIYDEKSGVPLNFNFVDYKFPTIEDFPDIDPMPMEVYRGVAGEFGCNGIGEGAPCCTPRAISNAIYNAIGVRVNGTAISPKDILKALGKAGE